MGSISSVGQRRQWGQRRGSGGSGQMPVVMIDPPQDNLAPGTKEGRVRRRFKQPEKKEDGKDGTSSKKSDKDDKDDDKTG